MRRTTTLLAAAPITALTLGLAAPAGQAAPLANPEAPEVIAAAEDGGVPVDPAQRSAYRALTAAAGRDFPGTIGFRATSGGSQLIVRQPGWVSALGSPRALRSMLQVDAVLRSQRDVQVLSEPAAASVRALRAAYEAPLEAAIAADRDLAVQVTGYGVHQERGTFVVRVSDAGDQSLLRRLAALLPAGFEVQQAPDATQPLTDRVTDDDPLGKVANRRFDLSASGHHAGAQLWMVTETLMVGTCTIGYGYRHQDRDYLVTAGHCAPKGGAKAMMLAGFSVDTSPESRIDLQTKGGQDDIAVAAMDMSDGMYETGSSTARTTLDDYQTNDLAGREVCHSGARTKGSCGWKVDPAGTQKVAFTLRDKEGKPHRVYLEVYATTAPVGTAGDHGDSGGPVYIQQPDGRKTLVGSLTGGGVNRRKNVKYMFFTGVQAAMDAMPGGHPITRTTP